MDENYLPASPTVIHLLETTHVVPWSQPLDKSVNWLADHQDEDTYHREAIFKVKGLYKEAEFNNVITWFIDFLWEL